MKEKFNFFLKPMFLVLCLSVLGCDNIEHMMASPTDMVYKIREAMYKGDVDKYLTYVNDDIEHFRVLQKAVRDPSVKQSSMDYLMKMASNTQAIAINEVSNDRKAYVIVSIGHSDGTRVKKEIWCFTNKQMKWKFNGAWDYSPEKLKKVEEWMTNFQITPFDI